MTDKTYALVITIVAALLASVVSFAAFADTPTVINYPDGSTYTLKNGEKVFVHPSVMYVKQEYTNTGNVLFSKRVPWPNRDYVEPEATNADGLTPGSPEWCETYVPYENGYTFSDGLWKNNCQG
tara:strand:- start:3318 stop:3689 length:372 start_codon:yes stop_codon:yes gene_type:complete